MTDKEALLQAAREANPQPDLSRVLRDMVSPGGYVLPFLRALIEMRDSLVESAIHKGIATEEDRHKLVLLRGQVQGIDTALDIYWRLMAVPEDVDSHSEQAP